MNTLNEIKSAIQERAAVRELNTQKALAEVKAKSEARIEAIDANGVAEKEAAFKQLAAMKAAMGLK